VDGFVAFAFLVFALVGAAFVDADLLEAGLVDGDSVDPDFGRRGCDSRGALSLFVTGRGGAFFGFRTIRRVP
jgi:hypothetical protein